MKVLIDLDQEILSKADKLANNDDRSRKKTLEKILKDYFN